ncbi:hypothetical protein BMF94_2703 [Rhodotorula taiwanensis]|uniref:MYND-type domain-containing protein n=1 Tax=Rhodotorula taiwanensis TaxID=741276 RepID=A0A2S5BBV4_9BASI|nr:hypothetical protein BMF94_2703 [Rhodotorula taiwanensis]
MSTAPRSSGACLACGAPASLRCSACATKSSMDIVFCSAAHQKEVWSTHKLVCGKRAHPFKLPPFSQQEADYVAWQCIKEPE